MTDTFVVEQATSSDFLELMKVLSICFNSERPDYPDFDRMLPDLYSPEPTDMANSLVIRDNGKIISHVALFPIFMNICGQPVEIGGLGGVCTLPEYRGKHLMQILLDRTQEIMQQRGYPLGWLSGDRRRYSPWGYENSGAEYQFTLSSRAPGCSKYSGKLSGKIVEGPLSELNWNEIWQQVKSQSQSGLTACGEEKLRRKYSRFRLKIHIVEGNHGAHIVVRDDPDFRVIYAYGGDPETLGALIAKKLESDWETVAAYLPLYPDRYFDVFNDLMKWYSLNGSSSLAVVDLIKTLLLFLPHFNERVSCLGLKAKLKIVMGGARKIPPQSVMLEADGRELHIMPDQNKSSNCPTLEITCLEMSQILFSPFSIGFSSRLPLETRWLMSLMPAPLYVSGLYHV